MVVIICGKYGNNRSKSENVTERTRFSKSMSYVLEDIGHGQRLSRATHLPMLVIICTKYGKIQSRILDVQNGHDFQGQSQMSLMIYVKVKGHYMQHTLSYKWSFVLNMVKESIENCRFFSRSGRKILKHCQKFKFPYSEANVTRDTPSDNSNHLCQYKNNPSRTVDATERTRFSRSRPNDLEDIGQGQGSSNAIHPLMLLIICAKYGKNPSWSVDATRRTRKVNVKTDRQTDGRTDRVNPIYPPPPPNFVAGDIINNYWETPGWFMAKRMNPQTQRFTESAVFKYD